MPVMFGGPNARFQRVHGDIVASYQYVNGERAMVLFPREKKTGAGAYVVCDSAAWKYDPDLKRSDWFDGGRIVAGPLYLMGQAMAAARTMGMDETKPTVTRIASIIAEGLSDLVRLPPEPPPERKRPIGEARLFAGGKEIAGSEV